MDWKAAIEKNREALKRVLSMLVALAGLGDIHPPLGCRRPSDPPQGGRTAGITLPRHLHRAVLRLLRPAEAAARRLVIVAARGITPPPPRFTRSPSPASQGRIEGRGRQQRGSSPVYGGGVAEGDGGGKRRTAARPTFALFDPPRRLSSGEARPAPAGVPRISFPGFCRPFAIPPRPSPDDPVDARPLALRLAALGDVLDDLPRHARRFARWQVRRKAGLVRRTWPLRTGRPPGHHPAGRGRRHRQLVHEILETTHGLAFWALEETPDTS